MYDEMRLESADRGSVGGVIAYTEGFPSCHEKKKYLSTSTSFLQMPTIHDVIYFGARRVNSPIL